MREYISNNYFIRWPFFGIHRLDTEPEADVITISIYELPNVYPHDERNVTYNGRTIQLKCTFENMVDIISVHY